MADETVIVAVKDKVDRTIRVHIDEIGTAGSRAQDSIDALQSSLNRLNAKSVTDQMARLAPLVERFNKTLERSETSASRAAIGEQRLAAATARTVVANNAAIASSSKLTVAQANEARASANAAAAKDRAAMASLKLANAQTQAKSGSDGLVGGLGKLAASYLTLQTAINGVRGSISLVDDYTVLQNKLTPITKSVEATVPLLQELKDVANNTRTPIEATSQLYARLARALDSIGQPASDAIELTETINKTLAASGSAGSEAGAALLQLSQAFNKGKLDGDEFRTVMELMPVAADAIAKELGVTRGELLKLAPEGKITSEIMVRAFKNVRGALDELPEPMATVDSSLVRVKNSATVFFGELDSGLGIVASLTSQLDQFASAIDYVGDKMKSSKQDFRDRKQAAKMVDTDAEFRRMDPDEAFDAALAKIQKKRAAEEAEKTRRRLADAEGAQLRKEQEKRAEESKDSITALVAYNKEREKEIRELERLSFLEADKREIETQIAKYKKDAEKEGLSLDKFTEEDLRARLTAVQQRQKKPEKGKAPEETRAEFLARINRELERELELSGMLADAREVEARLDRVNEAARAKKFKLTEEENQAFRSQIQTLQEQERVNSRVDQLYSASVESGRAYVDTIEAANRLLAEGSINQEFYNRTLAVNALEFERANDALFDYNNAFSDQLGLLMFHSREREIEAEVLSVTNELREKGIELSESETNDIREKAELLRDLNELRSAEDQILSSIVGKQREQILQIQALANLRSSGALNSGQVAQSAMGMQGENLAGTQTYWDAMVQDRQDAYAQIDEMRRLDLIREEEASVAKLRIQNRETEARLNVASTFFSNFEGMQRSNNREMAAVGKAAAITNAIINTYSAANAAYAAMAGIPTIGPALGAAAAAGAIMSGLANVQMIESQSTGFRSGGYTGNMARGSVAGVVHGQEYVFDAASTARLGRHNLESLRQGDASGVQGKGESNGGQTVVNIAVVASKEEGEQWLNGQKGDKHLIEGVQRNAAVIKRVLASS